MTTTHPAALRFPRFMTIGGVYQPVLDFRESLGSADSSPRLAPLDAYLIHLALEFSTGKPTVVDLACEAYRGGASLVCLSNDRVARVASRGGPWRSESGRRIDESIQEFIAEAGWPGKAVFQSLSTDDDVHRALVEAGRRPGSPLILLPCEAVGRSAMGSMEDLFETLPEAVVLILGCGRTGEDASLRRFIGSLENSPELRFWLLREHASSLAGSSIAIVAKAGNRDAHDLTTRIEAAFTTNYDFLNLVRDSCQLALEMGVRAEQDNRSGGSLAVGKSKPDDPAAPLIASSLREEVVRETIERLQNEIRRLERKVEREENLPLTHAVVRRSARRVVRFGRAHREVFAPKGSLRERAAKSLLQMGRSFTKRA